MDNDTVIRRPAAIRDVGLGIATAVMSGLTVAAIGYWTGAVPGEIFVIAAAVLAAQYGLRPALIASVLGAVAVWPLVAASGAGAAELSPWIRSSTVGLASLAVSWICGNLYLVRKELAEERGRVLVEREERQRIEAALRQARDEAEHRADEAEEARAALKDRERRLQFEAQLKDEFLATLAHELRNPLVPLRNGTVLLRLEPLSPTARHTTEVMDRQLDQLVHLIDDLMDASRIMRGQLTLQRSRVDLGSIIDAAVETAQPQLTASGVSLSIDKPSSPCVLDADATRIAQIILNLLSNAAKFTPAGGRVWLSAAAQRERVTISVRDSGIGIANEDRERVFGMFVQLNRDIHRTQAGLGIGLTLVRQMAALHGGTVSVWSAGVGQGSEFIVTLPLALEVEMPQTPVRRAPQVRQSRRVLVADDSHAGADSLVLVLRAAGHEVFATYDGRSAIALAESAQPEVALLDIGMPDVSGYDVARAIRGSPWGRNIRLIALTGWGQPEHRRRSIEAGFNDHVVKPVNLDALEELLQTDSVPL
jgi:signal transduction histidine kinase/ActR/RegA family two-component response regulator